MKTQQEQRGARLRLLVLLPIIITFSLALALIIFSTKTFFNYQLEEENKKTTLRVQHNLEEQIARDIEDIKDLMQLVEIKAEIKSAWEKQDRQQLLEETTEIFEAINATFDITHFYFHSLAGKNFLRVHRPEKFGDNINRKTLSAARETGELRAGLEVGTFGQLVLRVVKPWLIDGKRIGYLEIGKELGLITQGLKTITNADTITLINKQFITQHNWQQSTDSRFSWQQLDEWVIASSTLAAIPQNFDAFLQQDDHSLKLPLHNQQHTFTAAYFTLGDVSQTDVGRMVVVRDITADTQQLHELLANIAIFGGITLLLLSIGYFIYLGKIEHRLTATNRSLHQEINKHEQAENRLRTSRDELAYINRELESYSYSIAHDLRGPLRSITSFSQIVMEDAGDKLNKDETDHLQRVIAASIRMAGLIDDILQLSRISRDELAKEQVNLSAIVTRIQQHLCRENPGRNIEWDIQAEVSVNADPRLMERALENLVNNAWKYTGYADNAKISFGTTRKDNQTVYFVRDNGAGFNMDYAHKLFTPFQRLHNPREFTGNGVGLAIASRVIQRHHGRIWGEGEAGKGATFYFTLPGTDSIPS